jgi:hypothetical protein
MQREVESSLPYAAFTGDCWSFPGSKCREPDNSSRELGRSGDNSTSLDVLLGSWNLTVPWVFGTWMSIEVVVAG